MRTKKVHFTVDFHGLTNLIRDFWAEGKYTTAIDVLSDCNIPKESHEDLIFGKLKMTDAPNGKPGVDGTLVKDNWKPNLNRCNFGIYPTFADMPKMAERMIFLKRQYEEKEIFAAKALVEEYNESMQALNKERLAIELEKFPDYIRELVGADIVKSGRFKVFARESWEKEEARANVDEYIKRQLELDKIKEVTPDTKFENKYGWILPNGKYYGCRWMEHIWLAGMLNKTERKAEESGWIKIVRDVIDYNVVNIIEPEKLVTQKQIDAIFDYCQIHGMQFYPDWIERN